MKSEIQNKIEKIFSVSKYNLLTKKGHDFLESNRVENYIFDENGNKYLDCFNSASIYNLGRQRGELIKELLTASSETDQGNFPMVSKEKAALAKGLSKFVGNNLTCTVFSVIRGESIDFACKLARGYTKKSELISFGGAWLGQTGFPLSLSERKDKADFGNLIPDVKILPFNDINALEKNISKKTAGVIIEPIQVDSGCVKATGEFLKKARMLCDKYKAVLIFDETETGLGRAGEKFYYEAHGVVPDVLVIGEALGGGVFPIAATIFTQKLNKFLNRHPMIHLSTFGGSDIGCRVAIKALEIYQRDKPWIDAKSNGIVINNEIKNIVKSFPFVTAIEGEGMLLAVTFNDDSFPYRFVKEMSKNGVLIDVSRNNDFKVIVRPPLGITQKEIVGLTSAINESLKSLSEQVP